MRNQKHIQNKMIVRAIGGILCAAILSLFAFNISYANTSTMSRDEVVLLVMDKSKDLEEWFFSKNSASGYDVSCILENPGESGNDWFAIALANSNSDNPKFDKYLSGLYNVVDSMYENKSKYRFTDWYRISIAIASMGGDCSNVNGHSIADDFFIEFGSFDSFETQGVMCPIWGLLAAQKNGLSEKATQFVTKCIELILANQNENGGFSLNGKGSDVDVTAMAVTALAAYDSEESVNNSIKKAIQFLSEAQTDDGDFKSMGVKNAESTSQVIIALCTVGIDVLKDSRFIKSGNSVIDGLMSYSAADGGFAHIKQNDGSLVTNQIATYQAWLACDSLLSYFNCGTPLYGYKEISTATPVPEETMLATATPAASQMPSPTPSSASPDSSNSTGYASQIDNGLKIKLVITVAIVAIGMIFMAVVLIRFKQKQKNGNASEKALAIDVGAIILVTALLLIAVSFLKIESKDEHFNTPTPSATLIGTVSLTIDCSEVRDEGTILTVDSCAIYEGDTVYSVLLRETKSAGILLDTQGSANNAISGIYVKAIDNLYEFDFGTMSGWMYYVNDEAPNYSCSAVAVCDGDKIVWHYVRDYTEGSK